MADPRARLAALGVPLFDADLVGPSSLDPAEYARLLVHLARADARLQASIPCLLAAHDGPAAAAAVREALAHLGPAEAESLAVLYRAARCLIVSRRPDLDHVLGRSPKLPPLPQEPSDLPGPEALLGEFGLAVASDRARETGGPDLVGDAVSLFDTWLRVRATEHEPA